MNIPKQMIKEWCENYYEAIETLDYLANKSIPRQMLKEWCETYEEAIETLDYLANRSVGTAEEEIKESLEDFFIDNGLMSEEEFRKEIL